MLRQTLIYDTPGDFTFDSNKIDLTGGSAVLKLINNPSQSFSQAFTADTGFTYDATKSEFTGGVLRQLDKRPANSLFAANYNLGLDLNWATSGALTHTAIGTPTLSGNQLVVTGGGANGLYYENANIGTIASQGTVRFKFKPNYSGTPVANHGCMHLGVPASPTGANTITLLHSASGGTWRITARDSANVSVYSAQIIGAAWSPVAGTTYEIELVLDTANGALRLFINGTLHGTLTTVFTRSTTATRLYLGSNPTYTTSDASFDDVIGFSNVQHTATYTPDGLSPSDYVYLTDLITCPQFVYSGLGNLQAFTNFVTTDSNSPRYILNNKYWNGSAWVTSNNSYAQANSAATVATNISSLPAANALTLKIVTENGASQMSADLLTVTYTGQLYPIDNPTVVNNAGVNVDALSDFETTQTTPSLTSIRYTLMLQGVDYYWNGSAWAVSNGTYSEANIAADIATNFATLDVATGYTLKMKAFLHSDDGTVSPELEEVQFDYSFFQAQPDEPNRCVVYCFLSDLIGKITSAQNAKLIFQTTQEFKYGERMIAPFTREFSFDEDGYVETTPEYLTNSDDTALDGIVETESLSISPYTISIQYKDGTETITLSNSSKEVPNQANENLVNLWTFPTIT